MIHISITLPVFPINTLIVYDWFSLGYEKNKQEEERILSDLRTEGLLAKPGGKSKSGMSFEIVDMNSDLNESFVSTSSLLPSVKLRYLQKEMLERNKRF